MPPPCYSCRSFKHDIEVKYGDLANGELGGCPSCSMVLHAIEAFLPEMHTLTTQLDNPEYSPNDLVFSWNAWDKSIYLQTDPHYRLYLSTDAVPDSDHVLFSQHDTASGNTNSEASLSRILSWIDACTSRHDRCENPTDKTLPRRVLDIGETDEELIRLYDTQNEPGRYACLSHCWGSGQPIVTTNKTYATLVHGIRSRDLPLTFRDAISVARRLSIKYLWIDCFCIIQDSPRDLQEQCAVMDLIFENACLTIAATKSTGPEDGLFAREHQDREIKLIQPPQTSLWANGNAYVRNFNHRPDDNRRNQHWETAGFVQGAQARWPLLTRAWVFQERLLSPRIIHFGNELTWECRTKTVCECNFQPGPGPPDESKVRLRKEGGSLWLKDSSPSTLHLTWKRLVEDYTELTGNLTYESDIFPALAGLVSRFTRLLDDEYVAGLWRKRFVEGLLWTVPPPQEGKGVLRKWRAPTWSWASVCRPIKYVSGFAPEETYVEVLQIECIQIGSTLSGELSSANLTITGPTCQASLSRVNIKPSKGISLDPRDQFIGQWRITWKNRCDQCRTQASQDRSIACRVRCTSSLGVDHALPESWDGKLVECMRLARYGSMDWYLVLVGSNIVKDQRQRIGLTHRYGPGHRELSEPDTAELARLRGSEERRTLMVV